jgi:signal transduction histidine kinase
LGLLLFSACGPKNKEEVDKLNSTSYFYHYKNLDSTSVYARKALALAGDYHAGRAEAYNNLAFVSIMKMNYQDAYKLLDSVRMATDNQVELLVADVQQMRLCQRESRNKEFYDYYENAQRTLRRIAEERDALSQRLQDRMVYAESELHIVASTYYYYVGLEPQSIAALKQIDEDAVEEDTAQYLNYLYQIGAGGILTEGSADEIMQQEWDYLMRCYQRSLQSGDVFWEANALQGMSEHLFIKESRDLLINSNRPSMLLINPEEYPDSLLAGYLAERSLDIFEQYGDVYQIAGSYRTLASCYWNIGDYLSALDCLEHALHGNKAIEQAPDLVASIRERLSLTYSALDEKSNSDYNRNLYLDLQEKTRQDRQLEARAAQLDRSSRQLSWMIAAVVAMILLTVFSLFLFNYMRRKNEQNNRQKHLDQLGRDNAQIMSRLSDREDEIEGDTEMAAVLLEKNKRRNLENRAKIFLVNTITPLIDRMIHEIRKLQQGGESEAVRAERLAYIQEITDTINDYNQTLTEWIQLRQGELQLKIESFPVQELFDIVKRSRMSFQLKGIELTVNDTDAVVKADKILTLFMLNTIADNARKFTEKGGRVEIGAVQQQDYVELSVTDTGKGMTEEQLSTLFTHQIQGGHGFGLLNCRGIIERYKKISKHFAVCTLQAESKVGEGSRLFFRLPIGIRKLILLLIACTATLGSVAANDPNLEALRYADSAYFSNLKGTYEHTLQMADSVRHYLQKAERPDTSIILGISNETAVAALALHRWDIYHRNNREYTQLYKEVTADHNLGDYVMRMQRSSQNKNVAIFLLLVLLLAILIGYYLLYYRPQLRRQHIEEQRAVNRSRDSVENKRREVELMEDELHRIEYENQQFYISNNVIDNCLSTLKHETMYYPSRIGQLLPEDHHSVDIEPIAELAAYYKELYDLLSQQVVNQVEKPVTGKDAEDYLFELLRRESGEKTLDVTKEISREYVIYKVRMSQVECRDFFRPSRENIPYLICRQIVRENSEATDRHGCGIVAQPAEGGGTQFIITMAKTHERSS